MIFYFAFSFLIFLVKALTSAISNLPNASISPQIAGAFSSVSQYLGIIYSVAPFTFTALFSVIAAIVAAEGYVVIYKVVKWAYQKIPGIS